MVFAPSIDPQGTSGDEIFLPRHPYEIMESGAFNHVPYITGFCSAEALFYIRETILNPTIFTRINEDPELLVPFWWTSPGEVPNQSLLERRFANSIGTESL